MRPVRILLIGHGRMGRLVEALGPEHGAEIAGVVDRAASGRPDAWPEADVAVDFSASGAVLEHVRTLAERGTNVVIGTTGWQADEAEARDAAARAGLGVVAAPNFSVGVLMLTALAEQAAALMQRQPAWGAWIHELHHAGKRDAPSGTALHLAAAMRQAGYARSVDVSSSRAGAVPGTHSIGFDCAGETITLTHAARDRSPFARGALEAARWINGRSGWFGMQDVIGL